jgi:putative hydrolase of the HAD superfamily
MKADKPTTLFLDIGGVLLTNGWDTHSREKGMAKFKLEPEETERRHKICFDTYELGRMTLDEYLGYVIFHEPRSFTREECINFMLHESQPLDGAVEYFKALKKAHGLRVVALSNEPRELNAYRIKTFDLNTLFDCFISSPYVGMRKPDAAIYRMACDVSQTEPAQALYVDDQIVFIEVARSLGIPSLHYHDWQQAKEYIDGLGLTLK